MYKAAYNQSGGKVTVAKDPMLIKFVLSTPGIEETIDNMILESAMEWSKRGNKAPLEMTISFSKHVAWDGRINVKVSVFTQPMAAPSALH